MSEALTKSIPVDFFPVNELEKEAVENAKETEYQGAKTKIIVPEYLIALFLRTNRDKDKRKIQMLLEQAEINMEKLTKILNEHGLTEKFVKYKEKYYPGFGKLFCLYLGNSFPYSLKSCSFCFYSTSSLRERFKLGSRASFEHKSFFFL